MTRRRWGVRGLVVAALATVAATATGGAVVVASTGSTPPPPPAGCTLLTRDDVAAHLGPDLAVQDQGETCAYLRQDPERIAAVGLHNRLPGVSAGEFASGIASYASALQAQAEPVEGVGDEAYYVAAPQMRQLIARKGEQHVVLVLLGESVPDAEGRAVLRDLAARAASRLP